MFKDKYVFAQLVQFLDRNKFNRLSAKYQGDRYVKSFTCWNQLLVMMFGQLSKAKAYATLSLLLKFIGANYTTWVWASPLPEAILLKRMRVVTIGF